MQRGKQKEGLLHLCLFVSSPQPDSHSLKAVKRVFSNGKQHTKARCPFTCAHDGCLDFRHRHLFQYRGPNVDLRIEVREFHRPLLNLQLRTCRITLKNRQNTLARRTRSGLTSGELRKRGKNELTNERVRVGRMKRRLEKIDKLDVGYLCVCS